MRVFAIAFIALGVALSCGAQQACPADVQQNARTALRLQDRLRAVRAAPDDDLGDPVPPVVVSTLPEFKTALALVARDVVRCSGNATAAELQAQLADLLHANPPQPPPGSSVAKGDPRYAEWEQFTYGHNLLVHVANVRPDLLTVEFTFHITCGDDTVWLVFQREASGWQEKIAWYAKPYTTISNAFGDGFLTALLSGTGSDDWRAVVAHGHPWCTSRFSAFDIDVLAPSADPVNPRLIWHMTHGYSRGDYRKRLSATGDTFEFRVNVPAINTEEYERTVVYRYHVSGDHVQRIQPTATNGRGFVDEWLSTSWQEAAAESAQVNAAALHKAYEGFNAHASGNSFTEWIHGPVYACPGKTYQVEIKPDGENAGLSAMFFRIRETGNGYEMVNVTNTPSPECGSPNLFAPPKQ